MSNPNFNQDLYHASVKALTENGVPENVAERASKVVASDDFNLPDLGRTEEDRENIAEAMKHFWNWSRENGAK
ncbi:hypothetical protein IQ247_18105 [Plectonema cf. radiosum LEGE 06105]|uniref:Uncharacterized protein n=1 Tax=Plectonema cf. radiosum LEGE 06105 TaxID=945769 RepID=A0A8J7F1W2_9CYAN|nr:hypothetical protein [Plectonema radiosum]MBE9214558.1 hypothetical protein [Plectonema cf. radiosum LEGE 06105]